MSERTHRERPSRSAQRLPPRSDDAADLRRRDARPDRLRRRRAEPARPRPRARPARPAQAQPSGRSTRATRSGFRTVGTVEPPVRPRGQEAGRRPRARAPTATGVFDLTPTEDEQMLVDVVSEFADRGRPPRRRRGQRRLRGARRRAQGRPRDRPADPRRPRGPRRHRHRALRRRRRAGRRGARQGRHGPGRRRPRARPPSPPRCRCGAPTSSRRPTCPAFTGDDVPAAALALAEPTAAVRPAAPRRPRPSAAATASCSTA